MIKLFVTDVINDYIKKSLKREEPVKCGFHRRVMKKSLFDKQVFVLSMVKVYGTIMKEVWKRCK